MKKILAFAILLIGVAHARDTFQSNVVNNYMVKKGVTNLKSTTKTKVDKFMNDGDGNIIEVGSNKVEDGSDANYVELKTEVHLKKFMNDGDDNVIEVGYNKVRNGAHANNINLKTEVHLKKFMNDGDDNVIKVGGNEY